MIMRAGARVTPVVVTPAKLSKLMSDGNGDLVTGSANALPGWGSVENGVASGHEAWSAGRRSGADECLGPGLRRRL